MQRIGPYSLLDELGRGGMGVVYRARNERDGSTVALKLLLDVSDPEQVERFQREAQALLGVEHPNLVRVLDVSMQPPRPYAVFEYVPGDTLQQRVERAGPLPWTTAVRVLSEVAAAVSVAHERNLLHRDIKPDNVLLGPEGAKLADFGLVKDLDRDSLTHSGATLGTPSYLSPEQVGSERDRWAPSTDVYGLAATLYFALTGRPPLQGATVVDLLRAVLEDAPSPPRSLVPGLPPWLDALCMRGLAKLGGERYPSAVAFRAALLHGAGSEPNRRSWLLPAAALTTALALAAGGLAWLLSGQGDPPQPATAPSEPADPREAPLEAADWIRTGSEHSAAGRYPEALSDLNRALELDPSQATAWLKRGELLLQLERWEAAQQSLTHSLELEPQNARTYTLRAETRLSLGLHPQALEDLEQALSLDPDLVEAHATRGAVYASQRRFAEALPHYDRALELDPGYAKGYMERGTVYVTLSRFEKALSDLDRALELGIPTNEAANVRQLASLSRAKLAQAAGRPWTEEDLLRDRLARLEQALQKDPDDSALHCELGILLSAAGRLDEGLVEFERAVELDPQDARAYACRASAYVQLARPADALADFDKALELDARFAGAYVNRGKLHLEQGRYGAAIRDLEHSLTLELPPGQADSARRSLERARAVSRE